jgi:hypothetical protein
MITTINEFRKQISHIDEKKLKTPKEAWFKDTSEFWGTVKDEKVMITDEYWRNGEGHCKGYWKSDPTKTFDLPDIFLMDKELQDYLDSHKVI